MLFVDSFIVGWSFLMILFFEVKVIWLFLNGVSVINGRCLRFVGVLKCWFFISFGFVIISCLMLVSCCIIRVLLGIGLILI